MAAYTELRDALYNVVSGIFPANTVIWMYGGGTEPANPYVGLHILSMDQVGREQTSSYAMETAQGSDVYYINILANYEALIQVTFKGSTAGDLAHDFNQKLNSPVYWELMSENNLSKMRMTSIRNAPQLRDTKYVQTFNQDVTFAYAYNTTQEIDVIEQVLIVNQSTGDRFEIPESIG